ncbi:aminotransferase [Candidatus Acetothermia bacterium]|nr:MAG: aminotransferase [Candidatus Acetothermia bacterium]
MRKHFSSRVLGAKRSAIRELLKLAERPEIISFSGGFPDPETFPHEEFAEIAAEEIRDNYRDVLQYSTTEGSKTFRRGVSGWLKEQGIEASIDEILVTTASQQGLDLICKAFVDPADVIFCGLPTYLGAIQAFTLFQATKIGIPLEDDGMNLDVLEEEIGAARRGGKVLKGIYVIPDFQNPSGITMSLKKRERLLEIARREDLLIFEDNPYGHLRFSGEPIRSIYSLDDEGRVIMLVTFSKTLAAGLRLAVMLARGDAMDALVRVKQATDLCTSKLIQRLAARYIERYRFDLHLAEISRTYRRKKEAMIRALERYMPAEDGIRWTDPDGGLFVWMWLPEGIDTEEMLDRAIEEKVAYVPGAATHVDGGGANTLRLAFSLASEEDIDEGIRRLAEVVKREIAAKKREGVAT